MRHLIRAAFETARLASAPTAATLFYASASQKKIETSPTAAKQSQDEKPYFPPMAASPYQPTAHIAHIFHGIKPA